MDPLLLDVRLDGFPDPLGILARDENGGVAFAYRADYLTNPAALPLSMSLPLTDEPYAELVTRPFFDNLLQERDGVLADVMAREGLVRDDIAGLLFHLGKDCTGALSVLPQGAPPAKVPGDYARDYRRIDEQRLEAIVTALHRRHRLPEGEADPSPLAGVQSKIALTRLPDGTFAEPKPGSGAPTTHILKVPDQAHPDDPRLEAEALHLSRQLGFAAADAEVLRFDATEALLVTRFDRGLDADGRIMRLHQEDFAQALGLPAALKYERRGTAGRRFDVGGIRRILDATADPVGDKRQFIDAILFDLMIGNTDGHAKNFSLLYAGGRPRLSPRYDILPTRLDPQLTDELAFSLGTARTLEAMTVADFDAFLTSLGIDTAAGRRRMRQQRAGAIASSLSAHLGDMQGRGLKRFADLIAGNIRHLMTVFDLPIPAAASARDAFLPRAGGWLLS